MNTRSGAQRGDLILRFKVVLPARLSEEQARLPGDSFVFCALQSRGASWPRVTWSMLPFLYMLLPMISTIACWPGWPQHLQSWECANVSTFTLAL
jgi:hypothetical protein